MDKKDIYINISYDEYKKTSKCREIIHDIINASLIENNIENFNIYSQHDSYAKYVRNDYPFEFTIAIKDCLYNPDQVKQIILSYFKTYKMLRAKIRVSREDALFRYETNRINTIKERVLDSSKSKSFNINRIFYCYYEHITTPRILEELYRSTNAKTEFKKWFRDFSKKHQNFSFKSDEEINKLIEHDKEVLKHIKFMEMHGYTYSSEFSKYTVQALT